MDRELVRNKTVPSPSTRLKVAMRSFPGSDVLWTGKIDERIEQKPLEELLGITKIIIFNPIEDFERYIRFLERCPNATSISSNGLTYDIPAGFCVGSDVVPNLQRFEGPLPVARQFLPGRRVEEVCINGDGPIHPSNWSTKSLLPFAPYSGTVRVLELKPLLWHVGCIQEIAEIFPTLESLKLEMAHIPHPVCTVYII